MQRKGLYDPARLPDVYGVIGHWEGVPRGGLRFWICEPRGSTLCAVAKIVMPAVDLVRVREDIGRWLLAHGYGEHPAIIH